MRISLFSMVIVASLTIPAAAKLCPQTDLDGNCRIDWEDIQAFTDQWLIPDIDDCPQPGCPDFDTDGEINLIDFAILANQWLDYGITLSINEFVASNNSASGIHDPQN